MRIDRSKAPEIKPFGPLTIPDQAVERLPNGITLHSYSGGDQPVCRLVVLIPYSASELPTQTLPTLLPAMILAGSADYTADEIDDRLDFRGVKVTGKSSPKFVQLTANLLTEHASDIFSLLAEVYSEPAFDSNRLEACKARLAANILTARSQPITLATEKLNELYYGATHWMSHPLLPEDVTSVQTEDLRRFHNTIFNPEKIHIFLSGLLDEYILNQARMTFGRIKAEGPGRDWVSATPTPVPTPCKVEIDKPDTLQSAVAIGIPSIGRDNPDYIALRYTVMALGGYFGSRLMSNVREQKGLTYHISAVLMGDYCESMAMISALCDKSYTAEVVNEINAEITRLVAEPPRGEELRRLKLHAMSDLAEMLDNPANVMSYYVTQLLVGTSADYFKEQQKALDELTPEVISLMAERYLKPELMITVTTV